MKLGDWINRKRHNRGYGVQSPSAFFFVTQVLRERLPYYAYATLDKAARECNASTRLMRELFRITNHHNPSSCIAVGSTAAACAMALAEPSASTLHIGSKATDTVADIFSACNCTQQQGNAPQLLEATLGNTPLGMLYIGQCPHRKETVATAMRHANANSIIVIEGIHRDSDTLKWWEQLVADKQTIITYDMYSFGILLFNKERIKQHYTLKL